MFPVPLRIRPSILILALGALSSAVHAAPQRMGGLPSSTASGTPVDRADFVFVIDHSQSMDNEIAAVEDGLTRFSQGLQLEGIDARFAIVLFGGAPEVRLDFTTDLAVLADAFDNIEIPVCRPRSCAPA